MIEFGLKSWNITLGPLAVTNTKKSRFVPERRKESEVQAASNASHWGSHATPHFRPIYQQPAMHFLLLQIQHQYTIHEPAYKVSLGPRPRIKSHLCQIMPTTMVWFHIPIKVKARSRPQREIQKETSSTSLPLRWLIHSFYQPFYITP